jgi:hypothetical protein
VFASCRLNGIACPALLCLQHGASEIANFGECRTLNFFRLVADYHQDRLRIQRLSRSNDVCNQRQAAKLVQNLRPV